jgi:Ca2+-binding RTX toxin-like protein
MNRRLVAVAASTLVVAMAAPVGDAAAVDTCHGLPVTIVGAGEIAGTDDDDVIMGSAGTDTIDAKDGNDTVCAGEGTDHILGGRGRDFLDGGRGNDLIEAGRGHDTIFGNAGDDVLYGNNGDDTFLFGGTEEEDVGETDGVDEVRGGPGSDTIDFTAIVPSFGGFQRLYVDLLDNPGYGDTAAPGYYRLFADPIEVPNLYEIINGSLAGVENVTGLTDGFGTINELRGDGAPNRLEVPAGVARLYGRGGPDVLVGANQADLIYGGDGADVLRGGAGGDTLYGGNGDDELRGYTGDDLLDAGPGTDVCYPGADQVVNTTTTGCETVL